jgi:hypothetical protein
MIPKKVNAGFQNRKDTYSNKLAYVIYWDNTGKLRKEVSWQGWRDKLIPNMELGNEPTEGFVLNKKAGGYASSWNTRATYARVYDPRGFEIEISIDNLLYILENVTCSKGKGLESKFVYGWSGTELVLLPIDSPDYKEHKKFSDQLFNNNFIGARELKIGSLYTHVNRETYLYLGRGYAYDDCTYNMRNKQRGKTKHFWFKSLKPLGAWHREKDSIVHFTSINKKLTECVGEDMEATVEATELMVKDNRYRGLGKTTYTHITEDQIVKAINLEEEYRDGKRLSLLGTDSKTYNLYLKDGEYLRYKVRDNYWDKNYIPTTVEKFVQEHNPVVITYYNEDGTIRHIKGQI